MSKLFLKVANKNQREPMEMLVEVEMMDTRKLFGRTERLIAPVAGEKAIWVDEERLIARR
jgi:hypothetical protein